MQRHLRHALAVSRNRPVGIDCTELAKQLSSLRVCGVRRSIEPLQISGIGDAPRGKLQGEWRKIRFEYLRLTVRQQMMVLELVPQSITHTGAKPPGAAASLFGRRLSHTHRFESCHTATRREARHAHF